jgi:N-formylglutamate amidohydrolase
METGQASFELFGGDVPASPVVLSVPHAGRDYPLPLRAALRVPVSTLRSLEDRHVDQLVLAARAAETLIVQRRPRAWIDLNRAEHERDPRLDDGASASAAPHLSAKVRSGLGLVPRRTLGIDIWRRRLEADEVAARIIADHRPYHATLADALAAARATFGIAILLDVHSMPSLGARGGDAAIVLGDRFGRSAAARYVHRLESEIAAAGLSHALNTPYAGGHILDRHACPAEGVHAIQIEIDRARYLDRRGDAPGPGFETIVDLLRRMIAAVADEALAQHMPLDTDIGNRFQRIKRFIRDLATNDRQHSRQHRIALDDVMSQRSQHMQRHQRQHNPAEHRV